MSVALYDTVMARRLLLVQLTVVILFSAVFCINSQKWGISALFGGISVYLPNELFFLLTKWCQGGPQQGYLAWPFFIGEIVKIALTIVLLVVALAVFKAEPLPVCIAYLAALVVQIVVQIVAPIVINIFHN